MTVEQLENYRALADEVADLEERKKRLMERLDIMADTVRGSAPEWPYCAHTIKVSGISRRQENALRRIDTLRRNRLADAQEQLADVEEYISSVRDIKVRRMIVLRYVDGLTWRQVAKRMYGSPHFEEAARKRVRRFLEKNL